MMAFAEIKLGEGGGALQRRHGADFLALHEHLVVRALVRLRSFAWNGDVDLILRLAFIVEAVIVPGRINAPPNDPPLSHDCTAAKRTTE